MLKSQKPSGSVHVVILVILIIALVGILGLIFWHKYSNQKTETSVTSGALNSANVDPYKDWNTYESINTKYSIKYPKDWIALKETVQDGPYIRNFDPTSKQPQGGYPDGYINVRILRDENNADFRAMTGYTTTEWYDTLGKVQVRNGPIPTRLKM
jgi:hypothetical protein